MDINCTSVALINRVVLCKKLYPEQALFVCFTSFPDCVIQHAIHFTVDHCLEDANLSLSDTSMVIGTPHITFTIHDLWQQGVVNAVYSSFFRKKIRW